MLTAQAERGESIKSAAVDIYNSFSSSKGKISKVRIFGEDVNGGSVVLDTSFLEMIEPVTVSTNQLTGEVETMEMLSILEKMAEDCE